jgi:hypothetical protein
MCLAAAGIIGAIGGLIGGIIQGAAAQAQAEAKARAAEYNAAVARNNATAEANKGAYEVSMRREKGRELLAKQRAAFGISGALVDTGTPLTVFGDSQSNVNMDAAAAKWDAQVKTEAQIAQQQLYLMEAEDARRAGRLAMLTGIIGGVTGLAKGLG